MDGIVRDWNSRKGYGWIQPLIGRPDETADVFCHISQLRRGRGEDPIPPPIGARVRFSLCQGSKGLQAAGVSIVEEQPRSFKLNDTHHQHPETRRDNYEFNTSEREKKA